MARATRQHTSPAQLLSSLLHLSSISTRRFASCQSYSSPCCLLQCTPSHVMSVGTLHEAPGVIDSCASLAGHPSTRGCDGFQQMQFPRSHSRKHRVTTDETRRRHRLPDQSLGSSKIHFTRATKTRLGKLSSAWAAPSDAHLCISFSFFRLSLPLLILQGLIPFQTTQQQSLR